MARKKQKGIPTIMSAQEVLDMAFHRASKISVTDKKAFFANRKTADAKLSSVSDSIARTLKGYVSAFPTFEKLHPFYKELYDLLIGVDKARKNLSALTWCANRVTSVCKKSASQIRKTRSTAFIKKKMNEAYGRVSSLLKQIEGYLTFIAEMRKEMARIPDIDPSIPTVVIAGFPNVGKSLMVSKLSSGNPMVAVYPFTTKGVNLGHFKFHRRKFQVLDTPGLLDRPWEKRNDIEKQAILALRHLADCIVFLLDPTGESAADMETQEKLMADIEEELGVQLLPVITKVDKMRIETDYLPVSAMTGEGLDDLKERIGSELMKAAKETEIPPWENPDLIEG